ncbi:hypothetical protein KJ673_01565 [Patescibacteria group bacterium]|nr:hypothetical protein [Patescibacteria group bacterium]MBU4452943.1 hypothetical protein [Patescibacteria group bacterium]MCG2687921.1 hypothetical protein [Candidatus Parcubacteria bacterium]
MIVTIFACVMIILLIIATPFDMKSTREHDRIEQTSECDVHEARLNLINAYGRVMNVEWICFMLTDPLADDPLVIKACRTVPNACTIGAGNCTEITYLTGVLNAWADEAYQQVEVACRQDISCFGQANVSRAYDGTPLLK